jgi:hypothetical protein
MKPVLTGLAALVLVSMGCGDAINGKAVAEPEVIRFHEKLTARDFEAIYDSGSADFKAALPRAKAVALFEAIDRKLGPLQQSEQINWNVNTHNLTTTVVLVYSSKFKEGEATETFVFRIKDKAPELMSYNISSLDMMIK